MAVKNRKRQSRTVPQRRTHSNKCRPSALRRFAKSAGYKVLELLEGGAAHSVDIAWTMLTHQSGSRRRLAQLRNNPTSGPGGSLLRELRAERQRQTRTRAILQNLEKQGLVSLNANGKWKVSGSGTKMLDDCRQPLVQTERLKGRRNNTLIAYDIPERLKKEREELRQLLVLLGFKPINRSVYFSTYSVSKAFIAYLQDNELLEYVQLVEVNKSGTLRTIQ